MGSNSRNAYELKSGANKLEEINIAFELVEEALATVSAGSGQDIYLYSELSKNYAVMPFNENVYDPVHDVITTDFSSYHWSVISQTYASDAAAQYALAEAEAIKAVAGGTKAELEAWEAEAEKKTADSYATQPYNEFVIVYTSNDDGTFTETPTTDYSSLHHAEASQYFADLALSNSEAVNFTAGMVSIWNSDRKPSGWLWCDGGTYGVFSPTPALAYDELYQVLDDPLYVMTLKPEDWDGLYPLNPNGWYNPNDTDYQSYHDQSALPDVAELSLTVTVPDYRGMFLRAKDRAGSTGSARGIDTHGIVDFNTITWSQNKAHTHILSTSYLGYRTGNGPTDDNDSAGPDNMTTVTLSEEGGAEGHGTYQTINYIIRTKGVYNGDGSGSGGSGVTPIASEIDYADIYGSGYSNLQDTTQNIYDEQAIVRGEGDVKDGSATHLLTTTGNANPIASAVIVNDIFSLHIAMNDNKVYAINHSSGALTFLGYTNTHLVSDSIIYDRVNKKGIATDGTNAQLLVFDFNDETGVFSNLTVLTVDAGTFYTSVSFAGSDTSYVHLTNMLNGATVKKPLDGSAETSLNNVGIATLKIWSPERNEMFVMKTDKLFYKYDNVADSLTVLTGSFAETITNPDGSATIEMDSDGSFAVPLSGGTYYDQPWYIFKIDEAGENVSSPILEDLSVYYTAGDGHSTFAIAYARLGFAVWNPLKTGSTNVGDRQVFIINKSLTDRNSINYVKTGFIPDGAGDNSLILADGSNIDASGKSSSIFGSNTKAPRDNSISVGEFNNGATDSVIEVGIGTDDVTRADGFIVKETGDVQAPNRLAAPTDKSLVTADNYGVSTIGGTAKFRLAGTVLYIRTDGTDA